MEGFDCVEVASCKGMNASQRGSEKRLMLDRLLKRSAPSSIRFSHHKRLLFSRPHGKTFQESNSRTTNSSSMTNGKDVWKTPIAYLIRLTSSYLKNLTLWLSC